MRRVCRVAWTEGARPRPRISFGAPLPVGMAADGELLDVVLHRALAGCGASARRSRAGVPAGWRLVDLQDVWLAGPPLAGRVAAADYRIVLAGERRRRGSCATAARGLLAAIATPAPAPEGRTAPSPTTCARC